MSEILLGEGDDAADGRQGPRGHLAAVEFLLVIALHDLVVEAELAVEERGHVDVADGDRFGLFHVAAVDLPGDGREHAQQLRRGDGPRVAELGVERRPLSPFWNMNEASQPCRPSP